MDPERLEDDVRRAKNGEKEAFRNIVDATIVPLRAYIGFFLSDKSVAEDVLQETYLKLYCEIDRCDRQSGFLAWAKSIAKFEALAARRRRQRKHSAHRRFMERFEARIGRIVTVVEDANPLEEQLEALKTCLGRLAGRAKRFIEMRYFESLSYEDISRESGLAPTTARKLMQRARAALAECTEGLL